MPSWSTCKNVIRLIYFSCFVESPCFSIAIDSVGLVRVDLWSKILCWCLWSRYGRGLLQAFIAGWVPPQELHMCMCGGISGKYSYQCSISAVFSWWLRGQEGRSFLVALLLLMIPRTADSMVSHFWVRVAPLGTIAFCVSGCKAQLALFCSEAMPMKHSV